MKRFSAIQTRGAVSMRVESGGAILVCPLTLEEENELHAAIEAARRWRSLQHAGVHPGVAVPGDQVEAVTAAGWVLMQVVAIHGEHMSLTDHSGRTYMARLDAYGTEWRWPEAGAR